MSLVNEFYQKEVFPECIQDNARPDVIANHALKFLENPPYYKKVQEELKGVHQFLGKPGALERAAQEIYSFTRGQALS